MPQKTSYTFKAVIYKTGINYGVDVPAEITSRLKAVKGYIRIKGTVNGIYFTKSLVPVKDAPYRLYINTITIKKIREMVGQVAHLVIEQDTSDPEQEHPIHPKLLQQLQQNGLLHRFDALTFSRRKEVLRYINNLKTPETLEKNIQKVLKQLQGNTANVRVP
ncbi:hypothetical protein BEL04_11280 [Mucilaginibacter sp. PPCGB 2223]|uniref:YdeI/OmpD-associated family protein n=1 Tax=Mucilaginibacter sp. PPCGB 2223 TaxID=1886027 RepID=UPI00082424D7|nr:YdeI/OmpD-associated family protein [Mucilaginibacter sp. PPCGB 2223]OCX52078.1 hypothetical protein BEL04_11280 [Mucilaginibacter sp. PPCGB 2223]